MMSGTVLAAAFATGALAGGGLTALGLALPKGHPEITPLRRWIYPVMMLFTGIVSAALVAAYGRNGDTAEWVAGMFLLSMLVPLTVSDLKYRLLPDKLTIPAFVVFCLFRLFVHPLPIWHYALGFLIGGGVLYFVSLVAVKRNKPPMGGGDIKLMALLGLAMGAELVAVTLFVASLLGLAVGGALLFLRRFRENRLLPFGPPIMLAALFAWLYGYDVLNWYYAFFLF